jgi:hypothetical protein
MNTFERSFSRSIIKLLKSSGSIANGTTRMRTVTLLLDAAKAVAEKKAREDNVLRQLKSPVCRDRELQRQTRHEEMPQEHLPPEQVNELGIKLGCVNF